MKPQYTDEQIEAARKLDRQLALERPAPHPCFPTHFGPLLAKAGLLPDSRPHGEHPTLGKWDASERVTDDPIADFADAVVREATQMIADSIEAQVMGIKPA